MPNSLFPTSMAKSQSTSHTFQVLEALCDTAPDQVLIMDYLGNILEASPSACMSLGYTREEILQKKYSDISTFGKTHAADELFKGKTHTEFNAKYICKNGQYKDVHVQCCELFPDSQKIFITVARDLTEQKLREDKLAKVFEEITNMERLRAQYICEIVHDLKTPLTALKGFVQILLSKRAGDLTAKQEKFLRSCDSAVDREADLIESLGDYADARTGKSLMQNGQADVGDILRVSLGLWEPLAELNGLQMEVEIESQPMPIKASVTEFIRVCNNLLSNAVKYNKPGGKIKVSATTYTLGKVCISVKDTGVGIPRKEQKKIFERYYRSSKSSSSVPGKGIGLSVVSDIVSANGGEILLDSKPGKGSTFYIIFDLLETRR